MLSSETKNKQFEVDLKKFDATAREGDSNFLRRSLKSPLSLGHGEGALAEGYRQRPRTAESGCANWKRGKTGRCDCWEDEKSSIIDYNNKKKSSTLQWCCCVSEWLYSPGSGYLFFVIAGSVLWCSFQRRKWLIYDLCVCASTYDEFL